VKPQAKVKKRRWFCDKQKMLSLGKYPILSLSEARQKHDGAKKLIADGIDPADQAKFGGRPRRH